MNVVTRVSSIDLYRQAHQENPEWWEGFSVWRHIMRIKAMIEATGSKTLLDYGCGKGKQYHEPVELKDGKWPSLAKYWGVIPAKYDPAVPGFDNPEILSLEYDAVICTDVLEHAESPREAHGIVQLLVDIAQKGLFLAVACRPAEKFLADGRNSHTLVREPQWWAALVESLAPPDLKWKLVCVTANAEHIFTSGGLNRELGASAANAAVAPSGPQRIVVQARNCVPHDTIINHIQTNQTRNFPVLEFCREHGRTAVLVSGGPSWTRKVEEIRERQNAGETIVCVKSSHDWLIREGIIPYACVLLDPRELVVDYVANPHPEVRYFVASMVHPATLDIMEERKARVFLYHAAVGAGEEKIAKRGVIVSGGSCAATRAIPLLHTLGYRRFELYGYDSCYSEEKPVIEGYESAHKDDSRVRVEVNGKHFLTDNQLIAQSQDFEQMWKVFTPQCQFNVHGEGLVATAYEVLIRQKLDLDAKKRDIGELLG